MEIRIVAIEGIAEVRAGDDLAAMIRAAAHRQRLPLDAGAILAVAQKVVSKAENSLVDLRTVEPSVAARAWAAQWGKDPRLIEVILRQTRRVVKMDRGVLIAETHHGLVAANAAVDQSNLGGEDCASVLPTDPDASARRLREALGVGAVLITDTFGRPWREGLVDVAIGVAGLEALDDWRGRVDRYGRPLRGTVMATADQLAAMAGLVMTKSAGLPAALIFGFPFRPGDGGSAGLIRSPQGDLFR